MKNELILCSQTYNDTKDFRSFGNTIKNECKINPLIFSKEKNYSIYFYELYLKLPTGEFYQKPIPIDIDDRNFQTPPNKLYKRFFMVYNDYNPNNNNNNPIIIYAKNVIFEVELDNTIKGKSIMKMPHLKIYYDFVESTNGKYNDISVSFISNYTIDLKKTMRVSLIILIICIILVVITVFARMYVWTILNPSKLNDESYPIYFLINLIFKIFKYYGIIIFFFSFGFTAFWYIFYKLQYRPFIFLPSIFESYKKYYKKFDIVWGLGCGAYGLYMMFRIYEQVNCDVFFIDWEHDKDILENVMGKASNKAYRSPWRSIHIINQYNLLQKSRTISIPFCFCWLIMLYYSDKLHWSNYMDTTPNISWVEKSPEDKILRYFITTFILFIAGTAQYVLVRLVQIWIPTKKTEFLDLCSVANISVLILKESLRGFYIHGQSPLGVADTTLQQLIQFLEEEGKGKIKGRGITEEKNDDLQTYEIYLSYSMRQIYDGLYFLPTLQEVDRGNQYDQIQTQSKFRNIFKYIPASLETATIYQINKYMNNHLKSKIEQATMQSKVLIKDKTLFERFFEFPPSIDLTSEDVKELVFYKDKGENFDDVLFLGMELEWLIFIIYIWHMWWISLDKYKHKSFHISIFMTYVMEQIFYKVRVFFGEKNVAKKAVVDNRFL